MSKIELTPEMMFLLTLLINNAIRTVFSTIKDMSPEEVNDRIVAELLRNQELMDEINKH
jgi:hypothetical protein